MKFKRIYLLLSFVLLIVFFANETEANAMNTGFSAEELSEQTKTSFISNINILPIDEEPVKKSINCFDVNSNYLIAIGQKTSGSRKTICVYSNEGVFQYGYSFNCSGDFGVEWDEENLNIYFVRSDIIISLDSDGNISDIKAVQDTIDNNAYRNSLLNSTNRVVGETTYLIENDMGMLNWIASSYSQIIVKESTGSESIIYDVNSMQLANMIVIISIVCVFVFIAIAAVARQFIKTRRGNYNS